MVIVFKALLIFPDVLVPVRGARRDSGINLIVARTSSAKEKLCAYTVINSNVSMLASIFKRRIFRSIYVWICRLSKFV